MHLLPVRYVTVSRTGPRALTLIRIELDEPAFYRTYRMNYADFDELHGMIHQQPVLQQWRETQTGINTGSAVLLAACPNS